MRHAVTPLLFASLMLAACAADAPAQSESPLGDWVAEDILGGGVIDDLQTTLTLTETSVTGFGGCNRFNGSATLTGESIALGPVAATRMACAAEAANNQEVKFFDALTQVATWRIENGLLYLDDDNGMNVIRLSRLEG
jgi:heat shock protein HslJ